MTNGAVFYEGPSLLDGAPLVGIVTGLKRHSKNPKTGNMLQTWILRADKNPMEAIQTGDDSSICGPCKFRGSADTKRSCYVTVSHSPLAVYKAYKRGNYPPFTVTTLNNRSIRMGAYGDPAAIPTAIWANMATKASAWTGYTHQWQNCDQSLQQFLMASVDTPAERDKAQQMGWRTFRVRDSVEPLTDEISCPASAEMGHRTTCENCQLCQGRASYAKSIAILPHGRGATTIIPLSALRSN
jgi:hypothetical protein